MSTVGNNSSTYNPQANGFMSLADMVETFVPPDWFIEGLFQRRFIYSVTGQTGHAKTAVALLISELCGSTSIDNPTLGPHPVAKGRGLYLVGENPDDVTMRLIGAVARRDQPLDWRVDFRPGVFNIEETFNLIEAHAEYRQGLDFVIIDTTAAYFPGDAENDNVQLGTYARMLRTLTKLPGGPCVLPLCHPIKFATEVAQLVPRGGGSFLCEMDGNATIRKLPNDVAEMSHNKMRGPGFEPLHFKLEKLRPPRLVDAKGRQMTTVGAVYISSVEAESQEDATFSDQDHVAMAMLKEPGMPLSEIANRCGWVFSNGDPAKSRAARAVEGLANDGLAKKDRNRYVLTERGKDVARKASLAQGDNSVPY